MWGVIVHLLFSRRNGLQTILENHFLQLRSLIGSYLQRALKIKALSIIIVKHLDRIWQGCFFQILFCQLATLSQHLLRGKSQRWINPSLQHLLSSFTAFATHLS